MNYKILVLFAFSAIIGLFVMIKMYRTDSEKYNKLQSDYKLINIKDSINDILTDYNTERGCDYFKLKSGKMYRTVFKTYGDINAISVDTLFILNDRLMKKYNSDTLMIFRNNKSFFYIMDSTLLYRNI